MISNFLYQKNNLIISSIAIIATVIFISLDRFSFFSILIGIVNLLFIYLYQFKGDTEFLSYGMVFVFSFILIHLYEINFISQILSVILVSISIALVFYIIFFSKNYTLNIRCLYSIIVLFSLVQISNIIILLQSGVIVKALFTTLIFYLISGIIKLYQENKLSFNYIIKYSTVFSLGLLILSLNINHLT